MSQGYAWIEGRVLPLERASLPLDDPAVLGGWSVFETMRTVGGQVPLLTAHMARLHASARAARIALPKDTAWVEAIAQLSALIPALGRLRITVSASGRLWMVVTPLSAARRGCEARCVRGAWSDEPFLGGRVKHTSRAPWLAAVARAQVDDILLVDAQACFVEATTAAIVAVWHGALWSAPDDGRVLPSTTLEALEADAAHLGIEVRREAPPAFEPDLSALYLASATRWLSPVVELDGEALGGFEPVGQALFDCDTARLAAWEEST